MKYAAGCTAKRIPASYAAAVRAGCISSDRRNFLYRGHRCSPGAFGRTGGGRCDCGAFRGVGVEDLISIGTIGLIKAINTFNPEKKIKLATYASRCIENEILMYLRRNNKTRMEVSIDEPLNVDWDGNELLLSDILGTEEDVIYQGLEQEAEHRVLGSAISKLSEREQVIVKLRFGINMPEGREKTQKEVADLLGISQSYISRLEKRIMKRLRKEIARYE